jgi:hypothetical protein
MNKKILVSLGIVLGIIFFIIGYIYASRSAGSLPTYFPRYEVGQSLRHVKHSIAAFVVGVACFIFAWFQSGPKQG